MSEERCTCGRPKGHAAPIYTAPSFITEYPDGRKVQTSVAVRWGSYAARNGIPEVATRLAREEPVSPAQETIATKEEPKQAKAPAKRAAKPKESPKGQGSLF